ncbi:DNA repair protein RecN, partial [Neisseria sp. P0013.S004]
KKLLGNLKNIEPRFAESLNMLASIEAELGEISANMRDVAGRSDSDPNELAAQESRMGELMSMARKYRIEPEELPQKLVESDERLQNLQAAADLEALENTVARNLAEYHEAAHILAAMRHQAAGHLGKETTEHMQHLAMKGARFD